MSRIWAGIDSGKGHHHGLALDADGKTLLSRRPARSTHNHAPPKPDSTAPPLMLAAEP